MNQEKVLLVVVDHHQRSDKWLTEDIAEELEELIKGCRGEVVERVIVKGDHPTAATLIGSGKVKEIADICAAGGIDTIVFSEDLKGSQQRNLEETIKAKTIDRTQLILDIFARHAVTEEGKMQVELAQLEYNLPRLVGKGIALSRPGGGIGTLGPGETKLEMDRRRISQRIGKLQKSLKDLAESRSVKRKKRKEKGVPMISLVGYTNAGKSTLLNRLTDAGQKTRDSLFTTLDPLARQLVLPNHQKVVLSDTVGFMHDLPHHLIESFKATLEEVLEADLLLHVTDISHPNFLNRYESVQKVLKELGVQDKPALMVLNKIDRIEKPGLIERWQREIKHSVIISAKTGQNIDALLEKIEELLMGLILNIDVTIPIDRMDLVNLAHKEGQVYSVKYYNDSIHLRAALPTTLAGQIYKYRIEE